MIPSLSLYSGQRVLVTGHTGFKGAWLCEWLLSLGAEVHGLALAPLQPSLFETLQLAERMHHQILDIREASALTAKIREIQPAMIFHLAAQALVRVSYREPISTFATNALGTAHLLEAVRATGHACTVVVVTTDKCYDNDGRDRNFKESDPLGGHDPYSASKAMAELVLSSYRDSYFSHGTDVALASARAGNVIGGGDWAEDRLVPDCIRALSAGKPVPVRNPAFTRPWQHVLEPLGGYLTLGVKLEEARREKNADQIARYAQAFNFGPDPTACHNVRQLVEEILKHWPGTWEHIMQEKHLAEAPLLNLSIDKAEERLGWVPRWDFAVTVAQTIAWYRGYAADSSPKAMAAFTRKQIAAYTQAIATL